MFGNFEERLAFHCGPAMAGIKPANLISFKNEEFEKISPRLKEIEFRLSSQDIRFETVYESEKHVLIMVYQEEALETCLRCRACAGILTEQGYPQCSGVRDYIKKKKKRVSQCNGDFPHEIGVFLGYPVEDVTGFIKNKGKSFKLNGYWKVYGDEKKASHMFRRYTECRDSLCRKLSQGISLESALGLAS